MLGENRARKGERRVGEAGYMIGQGLIRSVDPCNATQACPRSGVVVARDQKSVRSALLANKAEYSPSSPRL